MLLSALALAADLPMDRPADLQADLHLDTPTQLLRQNLGFDAASLESGLPAMRKGGTNIAVMVLWPPRGESEPYVERLLAKVEAEDARLDAIQLVRSPEEARTTATAGKVAMVLALEGAHGIEHDGLDGLRRLHDRGLSILELTWSVSNRFAGSSGDNGGGLTAAGRELVATAQSLGILVDVSHASRQATLDTCAITRAPLLATHSDTDVVTPNARNLTDPEIRCIAASGGVIGVNAHGPFVGEPATVARLADHVDHLAAVGGIGVVGLGTDFDGMITPPKDLPNAAALPTLWAELRRRGRTDAELAMVKGENFLRAWAAARSIAGR